MDRIEPVKLANPPMALALAIQFEFALMGSVSATIDTSVRRAERNVMDTV
jgi:hypothetical protein